MHNSGFETSVLKLLGLRSQPGSEPGPLLSKGAINSIPNLASDAIVFFIFRSDEGKSDGDGLDAVDGSGVVSSLMHIRGEYLEDLRVGSNAAVTNALFISGAEANR